MANIFKAKTLLGRTGIFSHEVIAPNLVYNTGNQTIAGNKSFTASSILTIRTISGFKGTSPLSLNLIAANDNSLSPTVNLAGNINLTAGTGSIFGTSTYGSINLNAGGLKYDGQVNLNGNVNINNNALLNSRTIKIYKTGFYFGNPGTAEALTIDNNNISINTVAGGGAGFGLLISGVAVTPALYATSANLASTGSTLNTKIDNLSGYINSTDSNIVFTTGDQAIGGNKTFLDRFSAKTGFFGDNNFASGDWIGISAGSGNYVSGNYSFIGGGCCNCAIGNNTIIGGGARNCACCSNSTVGGGCCNCACGCNATVGGGCGNCAWGVAATVGGGCSNRACGINATIGGGGGNCACCSNSTVGGGGGNCACSCNATIGGGCCNCASCCNATIGGGCGNCACGCNATIAGGTKNCNCASCSTIGGGYNNTSDSSLGVVGGGGCNRLCCSFSSTIGGGCGNCVVCCGTFSTIGGGGGNIICCSCQSVIAGGILNNIGCCSSDSTIGGGVSNNICGRNSTIGGGVSNKITTNNCCLPTCVSFIGGGGFNCISNAGTCCCNNVSTSFSAIVGGRCNSIISQHCGSSCCDGKPAIFSFIGAGSGNAIDSSYSTIGGGSNNKVFADYGYIPGGRLSTIISGHTGAAILGDGENRAHNSFSAHSLTLDFASGVYFSNKKVFGAVPEMVNVNNNFTISNTFNSDMILANSSSTITGTIISGNATGFNASIIQIGAGRIQITGSGIGVLISSYNNQYKTAGQFATISLLHTGSNGYIMYGNTSL